MDRGFGSHLKELDEIVRKNLKTKEQVLKNGTWLNEISHKLQVKLAEEARLVGSKIF